ncbi:ATP-binding protein [Stigmatella sp. ncwal1]|uniref:histidine kinase n=1 Tax=Stigmatella ashevillensis TaxID=2995309 RepID=A0ABT5DG85_9BACT|nr:ATP-binding protein [Stigmatella ashevillena]MDC0712594.1 ATP-binding protein [Stigmatella ashevillena]
MFEQEPARDTSDREPEEPLRLAAFLRDHRQHILARWQSSTHALHSHRSGRGTPTVHHIPSLLEGITEALAHTEHGVPLQLPCILSDMHAFARLDQGFDIHELATEYGLLRRCILQQLAAESLRPSPGALALLEDLLDQSLGRAMLSYTRLRERTMNALDGMMQAAMDSPDVETLLHRLLCLLMETSLQVDSATILLCEGEGLQVRAALGLGAEKSLGLRVRGEKSFAGRIAARRQPLAVRPALEGVQDEAAQRLGLLALYGVPLLEGGKLIGVAHMGSRTTHAFSEADTLLFRTMAARATALIVQAQLRAREQAARETSQRSLAMLDGLLDSSTMGIAIVDRTMRFLRINDILAKLNGASVEAHLGSVFREMVAPFIAEHLEPLFLRILETGETIEHFELSTPLGSEYLPGRTWLINLFPIRASNGELLGVGDVVVDITARKRAELALEQAVSFREQLLAVLGHDLRNPLSAINASAFQLSRQRDLDARGRQAVERIRRSGARMGRMIDDILDFTRSRLGGGIPVTCQPMNMGEVCRNTLDELQATFPQRQLLLEVRGDTSGSWDPDRVSQVLGNLVFNALQHGSEETPVRTVIRDEGAHVMMEVWNEGEPIPPELLPNLFDPFKRRPTDQRPNEGRGGKRSLGLGLHIVRQLAQAHGGEVEVHSSAEKGTCFKVRWPHGSA